MGCLSLLNKHRKKPEVFVFIQLSRVPSTLGLGLDHPFVCPKQLLSLPAYLQANNPTRDKMVRFCTLLCISGGLEGKFRQLPSIRIRLFLPIKDFRKLRTSLASIVECDNRFSFRKNGGRKALGYRFARSISAHDFVAVEMQTKRGREQSYQRGQKHPSRIAVSRHLSQVHQKLFSCLSRFTIDVPRLPAALEHLPLTKRIRAIWNARQWINGDIFFTIGETGRVYSSGSNLKREIRSILLANGEPVAEIDVSCCQPVLLSFLLRGNVSEREHQEFASLTQSGRLYDEIASASGESRSNIKKALVKWLCGPWFDPEPFLDPKSAAQLSDDKLKVLLELNVWLTKVHAWFSSRFPEICAYMKSEKTNTEYYRLFNTKERRHTGRTIHPYAVISHRLQKLESQIIIDDCCSRLLEANSTLPILTAHDSLIVPASATEEVHEQMRMSFKQYELSPQITIK